MFDTNVTLQMDFASQKKGAWPSRPCGTGLLARSLPIRTKERPTHTGGTPLSSLKIQKQGDLGMRRIVAMHRENGRFMPCQDLVSLNLIHFRAVHSSLSTTLANPATSLPRAVKSPVLPLKSLATSLGCLASMGGMSQPISMP